MGKRKRNNKSEQIEDRHRKHKRPRSSNDGPANAKTPSTSGEKTVAALCPAIPAAAPMHEAVAHAIRILEPPSGFSKRQRKRWRLLTRRAAESVTKGNVNKLSQVALQTKQTKSTSTIIPDTEPNVDRSIVEQYSTTKLVPKPQKRWLDSGNEQDSHPRQSPSLESSEQHKTSPNEKLNLYLKQSNQEDFTRDKEPSEAAALDNRSPSVASIPERTHFTSKVISRRRIPSSTFSSRVTHSTPISMTFRRSSSGKKPTSIPSFSDNTDVAASFKRFSAFMSGRSADSDDESQESSEGDSVSDISDLTEHLAKEKDLSDIEPKSTRIDQASSIGEKEYPEYLSAPSLDRSRVYGPSQIIEEDDSPPNDRQNRSPPAPSLPFSRQANIGVKRHLSFLGVDHGGIPSGSGGTREREGITTKDIHRPPHPPNPFDESDNDSEYVLQTIDEVSRNVFAATRPLPARKLPISPDPELEDRENGLMTFASSDRRVTRSMSTPESTPKRTKWSGIVVPRYSAIVCNSFHVPETNDTVSRTKMSHAAPALDTADSTEDNIDVAINILSSEVSSSSLSEFSRSPSPSLPTADAIVSESGRKDQDDQQDDNLAENPEPEPESVSTHRVRKKRKMTGMTSKHFTPEKKRRSKRSSAKTDTGIENEENTERVTGEIPEPLNNTETEPEPEVDAPPPVSHSTRSSTTKRNTRKGTGKKSSYFTPTKPTLDLSLIDRVDLYNTTAGSRSKSNRAVRTPAGTSTAPVPPIAEPFFGIIQEKLWREPFWLLIAVTFLNKTTGRAAVPVFWELKKKYKTAEALAEAEAGALEGLIHHLGLQRQRSKRIIKIARAWVEGPPITGRRLRTLNYPLPGDGKAYKAREPVGEDAEDCAGALEIGHLPGCGPYAWDSWRMFCRDVLRGVADDYNGAGAVAKGKEEFVPEWKRVLPLDKELRACLRWMWLKEGWIWDHESGEKRRATEVEMEMAVRGEMEIDDEQERKFAAQAATAEIETGMEEDDHQIEDAEAEVPNFAEHESPIAVQEQHETKAGSDVESEDSASDNIVVTPATKAVRRSARLTA